MKTVFRNLVLSGILVGAVAPAIPAQSGPDRQEGQRKEKVQAVVANKNKSDKGRNGTGNSGNNSGPAKGQER